MTDQTNVLETLSEIDNLTFMVSGDSCVITHPDIGVVTCNLKDSYIKQLMETSVGNPLPPLKKTTVEEYKELSPMDTLLNYLDVNLMGGTKFKDNTLSNPYLNSLYLDLFVSFLIKTTIYKGFGLGYKSVTKDLRSIYDSSFKYSVGKLAKPTTTPNFNTDILCTSGIHISTYEYAKEYANSTKNNIYLAMLYDPKDLLYIGTDKVRCSKAMPVAIIDTRDDLFNLDLDIVDTYIDRMTSNE